MSSNDQTTVDAVVLAPNGSIFVNHSRRHRDAIIKRIGDVITVARVSQPDNVIDTYTIVEEVTDATTSDPARHVDAFDGYSAVNGQNLVRIGITNNCGCGGLPGYSERVGYSKTLDLRGKKTGLGG